MTLKYGPLDWLRWGIEKVRARPLMYLPRRLAYPVRRKMVDLAFRRLRSPGRFKPHVPTDADALLTYFRERKSPKFHFSADDIGTIAASAPLSHKQEAIRSADAVLDDCYSFRGEGAVTVSPFSWNFCPGPNTGWRGDLNRHFQFVNLGLAYAHTKQSRYADKFRSLSSSWAREYGERLGTIPWDDPFEVGARINAWVWAYFLFLEYPGWTASEHQAYLRTLGRMAIYLYHALEFHAPGNHILLEAKALALWSEVFPEFLHSERCGEKAWKIIRFELGQQVCRDGVHAERSTMYHRIVAGELAELLLIAIRNRSLRALDLCDVVIKMAEFQSLTETGLESYPLFGDSYLDDPYLRFSAPAIVAALGRGVSGEDLDNLDPLTRFAIGTLPRSSPQASRPLVPAKIFADGGYAISRWHGKENASVLVWNCGEMISRSYSFHAHVDSLSFWLAVDGIPILIDPGTEELAPELRHYFRSTAAHNTVMVDGEDQCRLEKRNEVWTRAGTKLLFWDSTPDCDLMTASHSGYSRLRRPVLHTRTIFSMRNAYWLIHDHIDGDGAHLVQQRFQVAPGVDVAWTKNHTSITLMNGSTGINFIPLVFREGDAEANQRIEVVESVAELRCGVVERSSTIVCTQSGPVPFTMAAVIAPVQAGMRAAHALSARPGEASIEIALPRFTDHISLGVASRNNNPEWTVASPSNDRKTIYECGILSVNRSSNSSLRECFPPDEKTDFADLKQ